MRISCEECGKTVSKPTKKQAERAMRMHKGRVHGNIKNRYDSPSPEEGNGGGSTGILVQRRVTVSKHAQRRELTEEQKEHRRQYQRDLRARKKGASAVGRWGHNFCPNCSYPLQVLAVAEAAVNRR